MDQSPGTTSESQFIKYSVQDGVCTILLNIPRRKNAFTVEMFVETTDMLNKAAKDPNVIVTVLTGTGEYFSSGNDLGNMMKMEMTDDVEATLAKGLGVIERFVAAFIDFPKPLIAAVNGPALGIAVTLLALCDVVYCSDKATFRTPFISLGQSPEGCSTVLFPRIMGQVKANEMLLFGKKISAAEACERGLVAEVFPDSEFQSQVQKKIKEYAALPKNSLMYSKQLVRGVDKDLLHKANKQEIELLKERVTSEECMEAVMNFFTRKSKL